jgi:adenosine deaminase
MLLSRAESKRFIRYLCSIFGIPPPLFKPLEEYVYEDAAYENLTILLKPKTDHEIVFHEFLHYVIDLIRKVDSDKEDDDNMEHRFISWLQERMSDSVFEEFQKRRKKRGDIGNT